MRSELDEVCLIDAWLMGQLSEDEAGEFKVRLLLDEALTDKVEAQRVAHRVVRRYAREKERGRLEEIYRLLAGEAEFCHQLKTIFT